VTDGLAVLEDLLEHAVELVSGANTTHPAPPAADA
jgi:hypothetical protein